ncbi:ATP-binding protein [Streptomyces sp. KLOTTS4A1]|uniref:ATP-binding protein n=1 Tax=Streptomyces sp. KLOTTS4A1 TaxID=3390996 RepID=UPI0039F5BE11
MPTPRLGRGDGGLIGRAEERARLRGLLDEDVPLVSVVGAAGVGKSALAKAELCAGGRGRTVVWVRWPGKGPAARDVHEPAGPAAEVLAALVELAQGGGTGRGDGVGRGDGAGRGGAVQVEAAVQGLAGRLRQRREVVLLLDDVDPVHAACVALTQQLLNRLPGLRILVTSRRPLGLGYERTLRLGPLGYGTGPYEEGMRAARTYGTHRTDGHPAQTHGTEKGPAQTQGADAGPAQAQGAAAGDEGEVPAVRLFLERARSARPRRPVAADELDLVRDVCRRLEGLPLAIEQAAYQLTRIELPDLAERLKSGQCWLTNPRAALPRQSSLHHSLLAVYRQCEPGERVVWSRASTFADAFTESSTAFLCTGGGIFAQDIPRHLARLCAQGVLTPIGDPGGVRPLRYRMTSAGREFGQERLARAGEAEIAAERCLAHGRQIAHVAEHLWNHGGQRQAVQLLREEHHNLLGVLGRAARDPQQAYTALGIVTDLWFWWAAYEHADEGRRHLLRLRAACSPEAPLSTREGWLGALLLAGTAPLTAARLLQEAWPGSLLAGDDATAGSVAFVQGLVAWDQGRTDAAVELLDDAARTLPVHAPSGLSRPVALAALGLLQADTDPRAALRSARLAQVESRVQGDDLACFLSRFALARIDHGRGRSTRAWSRARRILADHAADEPAPQGLAAVREFLTGIENGDPPAVPPAPFPGTGPAPHRPAGPRRRGPERALPAGAAGSGESVAR